MWWILIACRVPNSSPGGDDSRTDDTGTDDSATDDSGTPKPSLTCTRHDLPLASVESIHAAWGSRTAAYVALADSSGVIFERDAGTWVAVTGKGAWTQVLTGGSDGTVWAVGERTLLVRQDGEWQTVDVEDADGSPVAARLTSASSGHVLYATYLCDDCHVSGAVVRHWDGSDWTADEDSDAWEELDDMALLPDGRLAIVGGDVAKVLDAGSWVEIPIDGIPPRLHGIESLTGDELIAVGADGVVATGSVSTGLLAAHTTWTGDLVDVHVDGEGNVWVLGATPDDPDGPTQLLAWDGSDLSAIGDPGPWTVLADDAVEGLVAGGPSEQLGSGAIIGEGDSSTGLVETWRAEQVAPIRDLAASPDGTIYSAPVNADTPVGMFDGISWSSLDLTDDPVVAVAAPEPGVVLAATETSIVRWDGAKTTSEPFLLPKGSEVRGLDRIEATPSLSVALGNLYDGSYTRTVFVRNEAGWSPIDPGPLPLPTLFDVTTDGVTVWIAAGDVVEDAGALLSWTEATGTELHDEGIRGPVKRIWPRVGGGVWLWVGGLEDRGLYSFDGTALEHHFGDTVFDVHDVVDDPAIGALVSYQYGSSEGDEELALNDAPNSWWPVANGLLRFEALALTTDGAFLAGTDEGVTTFECAFSP